MEKEQEIPEHVFETFKDRFKNDIRPNIVRTRNITKEGLDLLTNKNTVLWSSTIFDRGEFNFIEGTVLWGTNQVLVYFKKIENDSTYRIFILTSELSQISLLLTGLNKFFTIDKI